MASTAVAIWVVGVIAFSAATFVLWRVRAAVRAIFRDFGTIRQELAALGTIRMELAALGTVRTELAEVDHRIAACASQANSRMVALECRVEALGTVLGQHANDTSNRLDVVLASAGDFGEMRERINDVRAATALTQAAVWADSLADFMTPFDWTAVISTALSRRMPSLPAEAFVRRRTTWSQPVDLRCADGHVYVVKGVQERADDADRRLFSEQVIGRLAQAIGAPVPEVALISIGQDLIARNPDVDRGMGHLHPELAHGMRHIDGLGERRKAIMHVDLNRERFAKLAILQAWTQANDRQFLYEIHPPHRVYSTDHGRYFADNPHWVDADLRLAALTYPAYDLIEACGLSHADLAAAAKPLRTVTAQQIAEILGTAPDSWGVSVQERAVIGRYLRLRQFHLLAMFGALQPARAHEQLKVAGTESD